MTALRAERLHLRITVLAGGGDGGSSGSSDTSDGTDI